MRASFSGRLQIEDRIELALDGAPELVDAAAVHEPYLAGETLALNIDVGGAAALESRTMDYTEQTEIDGLPLTISLSRSQQPAS